ncbi:30S ribosomal protein S1 [Dethiosulfovibrio salsuginis]|uniref:Small subunit ribosomal protein S1 n=1 Tax=Dethiosulfovibrio salsuginis TaxID=561720 RepID=A0A1X7I2J9_9BACT|nr:S1 RNA-binding domain-containing protein [Dethiosulfovibrio salsuginis]SMG08424.1 small subunit ribosomal protein S1 [Dethiosulfovibrio salsuginis]
MSEEIKNQVAEDMTMEQLLESSGGLEEIHRGKVVTGTVVEQAEGGWLVDVGYKCEGFLPTREWSHHILVGDGAEPAIGQELQVQVVNVRQGEESQLVVSRWRCEFDRRWQELEETIADKETFSVRGLRKVKGGLMVDCCSLEGFIPISHLAEEGRGVNPGKFIDEIFDVKLLEKDRRKRRLVLSRRSILDQEIAEQRDNFYNDVKEGTVLEGTVSSLTSFGVFVNLGPIDGLVHISELSWHRNAKPKDIVKKGDTVKVKVIGIDHDHNRISLSMRQTETDPWDTVEERWKPGEKTVGTVTNVTDFGAFVEVEPGIEGLVHIGDLSWARIKHPKEVVKKGQELETVVLSVDPVKKRLSLGYKQLNDPWNGIEDRYSKGQDLPVTVVRLADFGAFVELEKGVEGLIHISQLSNKRVDKPGDVLAEGQEITARIIEVNPNDRRIRLSLSALEEGDKRERPAQAAGGRRKKSDSEKPVSNFQSEEGPITLGDAFGDIFDRN